MLLVAEKTRYVMVRFDTSIVTVNQSCIVSHMVGCPCILSDLVVLESVVKVLCTVPVTVDYDSVAFVLS